MRAHWIFYAIGLALAVAALVTSAIGYVVLGLVLGFLFAELAVRSRDLRALGRKIRD